MKDKVLRFCWEQQLVAPGDTVTCAVSGGPDSMALLACFLQLRETLGITVCAAHYHHGLRASADGDEALVREFCGAQGVSLTVGRGDVAAMARTQRQSVETAARDARYAFLMTCPGTIATAHTAGDNAETILMNLTRGTGLRGLCGIPPRRDRLIRPMLPVTREEVLAFLTSFGIPWREDETNRLDDCRRNRLRHHVLPLLRQENPALDVSLSEMSLRLRDEEDYLEQEAKAALERTVRGGGYAVDSLRALPLALQRRALRSLLQPCGAADAFHTEALQKLLWSEGGILGLPGGWRAVLWGDLLQMERPEPPRRLQTAVLPVPGTLALPECRLRLQTALIPFSGDFSPRSDTYLLNYGMIEGEIVVRARETGDRMLRSSGHKTVKRLMIDRKIPERERACCPVLTADGRILAVYGLGVSQEYAPAAGAPVLAIQFLRT